VSEWRLFPKFETKEGKTLDDLLKERAYLEALGFIETELMIIESEIKKLKKALDVIKKEMVRR